MGGQRRRILQAVTTASIQRPGHYAPPHDHGECWAVYGVIDGSMRMTRYERFDDLSDDSSRRDRA